MAGYYDKVPRRLRDGSLRMRAPRVDARSQEARNAGVKGARKDAFGNVVEGIDPNTGQKVKLSGGESGVGRFKSGKLTPSLNAFEAGMRPAVPRSRGRLSPRPGDSDFVGPVSREAKREASKTTWDKKRDAALAREKRNTEARVAMKERGDAFAAGKRRLDARVGQISEQRKAGTLPGTKEAGRKIAEAGKKSRSAFGDGLAYSVDTPHGKVSVRNGPAPSAVAKGPPSPVNRSGVVMPPGGPDLNAFAGAPMNRGTNAATVAASKTQRPAWEAAGKVASRPPAAPSAPAAPATRPVPASVAANRERLKAGDAVAKGMFGGLNEPILPKVGSALKSAAKFAGDSVRNSVTANLGFAKSAFDGARDFQKKGLVRTGSPERKRKPVQGPRFAGAY